MDNEIDTGTVKEEEEDDSQKEDDHDMSSLHGLNDSNPHRKV